MHENPARHTADPRRQRHGLDDAGQLPALPPATFFPSDGVGVDKARKICVGCPVTEPCLEYALEHRIDHGVWGGCSERERRRILKRRRLALTVQ